METGINETQTLLTSQKDLSFVPNTMEGLKEGEPMSQDSNPSPVCCPPPSEVNRILERLSALTMEDLARIDAWLDKGLDGEETPWTVVRKKKKKNNRDPSPASPLLLEARPRQILTINLTQWEGKTRMK